MTYSFGLGCSDDDKYTDFEAWRDPYFCCDQFYTSTAAFEAHKLLYTCQYYDDCYDSFDEDSDCMDDSFGSGEDGFDDSEDEAMTKYIFVTSTMPNSATESKEKSQGHLPDACGKCGIGPFQSLAPFLQHMAMIHKACGVCQIGGLADQKTGLDEYHYSHAQSCARHGKRKSPGAAIGKPQKKVSNASKDQSQGGDIVKLQEKVSNAGEGQSQGGDIVKLQEKVSNAGEGQSRGGDIGKPGEKASNAEEGDKVRSSCLTCEDLTCSGKALNQHCAVVHNRCRICRIQFDTHNDLDRHFSSSKVHLRKYCAPCKMAFSCTNSLSVHCAVVHPIGRNYSSGVLWWPCDACTKGRRAFPTEEKLEAHLESEHIRCFPCKREFAQSRFLYAHLAASSHHNYCTRCELDFVSTSSFEAHNCPGEKAVRGSQKSCWVPRVPSQDTSVADAQLGTDDKPLNPFNESISAGGENASA